MENNTISSIDGATALKLDESYELEEEKSDSLNNYESHLNNENLRESLNNNEQVINNLPSGVSIESASYIENNSLDENENSINTREDEVEHTPKLFSEDQAYQSDEPLETQEIERKDAEESFDQNTEEEDFDIPAFLRKQKF